jgi:Plasmid pRiA4b ORF-3-like protein
MSNAPQLPTIYQLRLVLAGISPMIWRRLLVSTGTNIAQLHGYIQIAFDWTGEHLHRFHIHGKDYGIAYRGGLSFDDNPREVLLSRFCLHAREMFRYEYDFTAKWRIDIRVEAILPRDQQQCVLPVCTAGRGAAPGEEYGGAIAYMQRLDRHRSEFPFEALGTMAQQIRCWLDVGGSHQALGNIEELHVAAERVTAYYEFRPDRCDRRHINRKLQAVVQKEAA